LTPAIGLFRTPLIMNNQNNQQSTIRSLKKSAHNLKPVVQIGKKGITSALIQEINQALEAHELIKIQVLQSQKPNLESDTEIIISKTGALHVATIGNIIILFRQRVENSLFDILP
jgi:RNA-binding protein